MREQASNAVAGGRAAHWKQKMLRPRKDRQIIYTQCQQRLGNEHAGAADRLDLGLGLQERGSVNAKSTATTKHTRSTATTTTA
jgi:hypothetical protein